MFKLSNLSLLTVLAVPLVSLPAWAQGFEPFPNPSSPESSPSSESSPSPESSPPPASNPSSNAAQSPYFRSRAKNLARQAAERANGGLSQYRAETAMSGPALTAPYVENADGSLTFTFKGGPPGGEETIETVATVVSSGAVNLDYNGPIRGSDAKASSPAPASTSAPSSGLTPAPAPSAQPSPAQPIPIPVPQPQQQTLPSLPVAPAPSSSPSTPQDLPKLTPQSSRQQPATIRPLEQTLPTPTTPSKPIDGPAIKQPQAEPSPSSSTPQDLPKLSPQSSRPQPVTIQPLGQALPTPAENPTPVVGKPTQKQPQTVTAPSAYKADTPKKASISKKADTSRLDTALSTDLFVARAKNLARQAAIQTNGGLGQYRPDARMFGPASQAPYVKNSNGSITFTFRGGTPGAEAQTLESEVTVAQDNQLTINYNGPIR